MFDYISQISTTITSSQMTQKQLIALNARGMSLEARNEEQKIALQRRLNAMVRDGQLIRNRKGLFTPVLAEDLIVGSVIGHQDGFGSRS